MKKRTAFYISLGMVTIFFASGYVIPFLCGQYDYTCQDKFEVLFPAILIFLPTLLFSIITYKMREEVFRAWLHFAYWWIPISLVFIYLAGGWSGGGFGIPNVLDQEFVSIIFSALFVIISLIIIAYKHLATRRTSGQA